MVLAALNCVSESPPGSSGGPTDSGVSVSRGQDGGMWADTMSEGDDSRSAEIRSATNWGSVGAATSEMPSRVGGTIHLEEDRRLLSRHSEIGLDNHSRYIGFILHSFRIAGVNCEDQMNSWMSRGLRY